jgi:hypothetical protein
MMDTFLSAVSKRHIVGRLLLMAMAEQSLDIGQIMCTTLYIRDHLIKLVLSLSVKSRPRLEQTSVVA